MMDRLSQIFTKQTKLFERFSQIETKNGVGFALVQGKPFNIDCRFWQALFKEQAWRITEEVFECLDAEAIEDKREEAIDVLHFVVELFIKTDCQPSTPVGYKASDRFEKLCLAAPLIYIPKNVALLLMSELGMTMNKLKNKPWKQSHKGADIHAFYEGLDNVFKCTLALCMSLDMSSEEIFDTYMGKANKNNQRIDAGE